MLARITGPELLVRDRWLDDELRARIRRWTPRSQLGLIVREILIAGLTREAAQELLDRITSCVVLESRLSLVALRHPDSPFRVGRSLREDYGVVSRRVITNAGVDQLENAFRNVFEPELFNFHALGTGALAEAVADAALGTEWLAADYTGGVRATGTQSQQAANVYRTIGTNTKASAGASAVTEHGLFSQAALAGGTLWDRSVFAAVNLNQNDGLQSTYDLTLTAGG